MRKERERERIDRGKGKRGRQREIDSNGDQVHQRENLKISIFRAVLFDLCNAWLFALKVRNRL